MKKKLVSILLCGTLMLSMISCAKKDDRTALQRVQEEGVLKVAVSPDFAPYEFEDPSKSGQDRYVGSDVSFAKYLAEQLGVKMEVVAMDFDACVAAVKEGKADCSISALYPSEERRKNVDFTDAYFDDSRQCIVISKADYDKYVTVDDLTGTAIAAQNGSAQVQIATSNIKDCQLQLVNKATDGVQMVKSGKAVGIVLQGGMAESVVASDDSLTICQVEFTEDESELVVAVQKGETELLEKMNEVIEVVNDEKMYDQWLIEAQEMATSITAAE